jgi:hypothetical protein
MLEPLNFGKTWGNQNCHAYAINNTGTDGQTNITPGQFKGSYDLDNKSAISMDEASIFFLLRR